MNRLQLLMIVEARKVIEPLIRVIITHMTDVPRTGHSLGLIKHSMDIDSPSLVCTGRTLIGRPASGLADQLAHVLVAALEVFVASLISENT